MAEAVTLAELRGLARLHRAEVDGAERRLATIIEHDAALLPDLLGFPAANLAKLHEHDDPVGLLVSTIEGASRVARERRAREAREHARALASHLAETASYQPDGNIELVPSALRELLAAWPGRGALALGSRGCVDVGRLRAVVRECRRVSPSIVVTNDMMLLTWRTSSSRGYIKLAMAPIAECEDALVVPLDVVADAPEHVHVRASDAARDVHVEAPAGAANINMPPSNPVSAPITADAPNEGDRTTIESREDAPQRARGAREVPTHPVGRREAYRGSDANRARRGIALRFIEAIAHAMAGAP